MKALSHSIARYSVVLATLLVAILPLANADTALQQKAQRLISTNAQATRLVFDLGVESQLVAVDVTSELPQGYEAMDNIGYHRNLSAEGLLGLSPTIVLGSDVMGPPPVLAALEAAGVKLVKTSTAMDVAQLVDNTKMVADALGQQDQGVVLADEITSLSTELTQLASSIPESPRVALLLAMDMTKPRLAGTETTGQAFVDLLNGQNVAQQVNYQTVSTEGLLALQPDMIIVVGRNVNTAIEDLLSANPMLSLTPASKNNRIYSVTGSSLISGLSLEALQEATRILKSNTRVDVAAGTK